MVKLPVDVKRARKSSSQSRKHDANRQRIVDAARGHFFNHGFRSVTMDDLAVELGISKKTLYAHFPGKIDLLEAVLADRFEGVETMLKEVTRAQPHDFPATLQELLAGTQRELDEIKPPFVRDMRQKAPQGFRLSSAAGLHCFSGISESFSSPGNGREWCEKTFRRTLSSRFYWRLFRRS